MHKHLSAGALALCAFAAGYAFDADAAKPTKNDPTPFELRAGARCAVKDVPAAEKAQIEAVLSNMSAAKGHAVVPVWFHVITTATGGGDVSALIPAQLQVLNAAFADAGFSFELRGVTTTPNDDWFYAASGSDEEVAMKQALRRGGPETLNVYTTNGDVYLGWATLPHWAKAYGSYDGVVLWWAALPGTGLAGADPDEPDGVLTYDQGDTGTHEVGHWLGLYHTFDGGCSSPGDFANDTPAEAIPQFYCAQRDSCAAGGNKFAGLDPVTNFMDYVDDVCMDHFTPDQEKRMRQSWIAYRR